MLQGFKALSASSLDGRYRLEGIKISRQEKMTPMASHSTDVVYQLHIRLAHIEPPIWRRIVVSGQVTLFGLHRMLQVVMGWENESIDLKIDSARA